MSNNKVNMQVEIIGDEKGKHTYEVKRVWDESAKKCLVIELYPTISVLDSPMKMDLSTLHLINRLVQLGYGEVRVINLYSKVIKGKPTVAELSDNASNMGYIEDILSEKDIKTYDVLIAWGSSSLMSHQTTLEYAVNLKRTPYWSDYQTNEQYFGLLSFDPGEEKSVCYVDGDVSEWSKKDIVSKNGDMTLSMKYDERFVYFRVHKPNLSLEKDTIYIPIDTTPKSGAKKSVQNGLSFNRAADFLITLHGQVQSKIQVQEYYEALRANYAEDVYGYNTYFKENVPKADSKKFVDINMILKTSTLETLGMVDKRAEVFHTGELRYGNANPKSKDFDSLADYMALGDDLELKIPWQLLNFADPSTMTIHDDYYAGKNCGINYINIDSLYAGVCENGTKKKVSLDELELKGWGTKVTSHERLKASYYEMQKMWK